MVGMPMNLRPTAPFLNVNSMYNRMLELSAQTKLNYARALRDGLVVRDNALGVLALRGNIPNSLHSLAISLVADSLFCLSEMVRICRMYGINYNSSHSLLGAAHQKLADWCSLYAEIVQRGALGDDTGTILHNKVVLLIGAQNISSLNYKYHLEQALHHYHAALEMHRGGRAYKEVIEDMIYLEGDCDDSMIHFFAALERFRINSKNILERIQHIDRICVKV
jgi:hypothetical protein